MHLNLINLIWTKIVEYVYLSLRFFIILKSVYKHGISSKILERKGLIVSNDRFKNKQIFIKTKFL